MIYLDEKGKPIPPKEAERAPQPPPSEQSPTAEREQQSIGTSEDKGAVPTGETEPPPPSVTGSPPDRAMPAKPEPLTFDDLPKSDADWERLLSESPLSELENRLSEDGLREIANTLNQYGVEEGIKRIEATDPALAQRLRQRLLSNKRANPSQITPPSKQGGPVGNENGGKQ